MTAPVRLTNRGRALVRVTVALVYSFSFMVGVFAPWYWVRVR